MKSASLPSALVHARTCFLVAVHNAGPLDVEHFGMRQATDGSLRVLASEASTHGELEQQSMEELDNPGFWTKPSVWVAI